jgi:hypothetical protein
MGYCSNAYILEGEFGVVFSTIYLFDFAEYYISSDLKKEGLSASEAKLVKEAVAYELTMGEGISDFNQDILTKIKEKALDENLVISPKKNEFSFKFSNTNNEVTFKLLTHGDENDIEKEIQGLKKINPQGTFDMSTRLKYIITSVNGSYDKKSIREFIDQGLIAKDARELRKYISEISPGIDLKYTHYFEDGGAEDIDIPIGVTFFWPDA